MKKLKRELRGLTLDVVVVENGSSLLRGLAGTRYFHIAKRGLGGALKLGIKNARSDKVFFLPADMSYGLAFVKKAMDEKADMVLGSKTARGAVVRRPLFRMLVSTIYGIKVKHIDGVAAGDVTGVKMYRRSAVMPLLEKCDADGIGFEVQLVKLAQKEGLKIAEIPVVVHDFRRRRTVSHGLADYLFERKHA